MKRYLAVMGMGFLLGFRHHGIDDDAGIDSEIVEAIRHKNTPKISRRDESAVCNFTQTILTEREVDDDTYQAALDVLGKAGLVELVGLIGSYSLTSMTLNRRCQNKLTGVGEAGFVASVDEKYIPLFQDFARIYSLGCDDVCPFSTVVTTSRGFAP